MSAKALRAFHFTDNLKLSSIVGLFPDKPHRLSGSELVYKFAKDQFLLLYNFGAMVSFNLDPEKEKEVLSSVQQFVSPKETIITSEDFLVEEGDKLAVDFRRVVLPKVTVEDVQIISLVLAQSTALEFFERHADALLQQSRIISEELEKTGKTGRKDSELVKFIGLCLNMKQNAIGSTYLLDSPEPAWEHASLEALYRQMEDMFELKDRFRILDYKLQIIQDTVEVLSDLSRSRREYRLELSIVILIAVEIVLILYELFGR